MAYYYKQLNAPLWSWVEQGHTLGATLKETKSNTIDGINFTASLYDVYTGGGTMSYTEAPSYFSKIFDEIQPFFILPHAELKRMYAAWESSLDSSLSQEYVDLIKDASYLVLKVNDSMYLHSFIEFSASITDSTAYPYEILYSVKNRWFLSSTDDKTNPDIILEISPETTVASFLQGTYFYDKNGKESWDYKFCLYQYPGGTRGLVIVNRCVPPSMGYYVRRYYECAMAGRWMDIPSVMKELGSPLAEFDPTFGDESDEGGYGGGSFDDSSDTIGIPTTPSIGISTSGMVNVYKINENDLIGFGSALFPDFVPVEPPTEVGVGETLASICENVISGLNLFTNSQLIQYIIDCHIMPISPPTATKTPIKVGFKVFENNEGNPVMSDYVTYDCGSVSLPEYYQNFLDYTGTQIELFLPFVGFVPIQNEWIQGGSINVQYRFNIIDGSFMAYVIANSSKSRLQDTVVGQYSGNCCVHIPITGQTYSSLMSGLVGGALGGIMPTSANMPTLKASADILGSAVGNATGFGNVQTSGNVQSSNGYSSSSSFLGVRTPYLKITRTVASFPSNYGHENGFPLNVTKPLSNVSGYTQCSRAVLDGITAPDSVKEQIATLLASGIYI